MASKDVVRYMAEPHTKISFPSRISPPGLSDVKLHLGGVGVRKRWFFNVYAMGLYFEPENAKKELARWNTYDIDELSINLSFYQNVISSSFTKLVRLVTNRDIKGADMKFAFEESLRPRVSNFAELYSYGHAKKTQRQVLNSGLSALNKFKAQFQQSKIKKGSEILVWNEGITLKTAIDGELKFSIDDHVLCSAFFDVYLGENCIHPSSRRRFALHVASLVVQHNHLTSPTLKTRLGSLRAKL